MYGKFSYAAGLMILYGKFGRHTLINLHIILSAAASDQHSFWKQGNLKGTYRRKAPFLCMASRAESKILTADKLAAPNWPASLRSSAVNCRPSLPSLPIFARQIREHKHVWTHNLVSQPANGMRVMDCWNSSLAPLTANERRPKATVTIYSTTWNFCIEKNQKSFWIKEPEPQKAFRLIIQREKLLCVRVCLGYVCKRLLHKLPP